MKKTDSFWKQKERKVEEVAWDQLTQSFKKLEERRNQQKFQEDQRKQKEEQRKRYLEEVGNISDDSDDIEERPLELLMIHQQHHIQEVQADVKRTEWTSTVQFVCNHRLVHQQHLHQDKILKCSRI